MKNGFERFPFIGWLTICATLLVSSVFVYQLEKRQYRPSKLAAHVVTDFQNRESVMQNWAEADFKGAILPPADEAHPIFLYFETESNKVIRWNSNKIPGQALDRDDYTPFLKGRIAQFGPGVYYVRSWKLESEDTTGHFIVGLIPIAFYYPFENQYFKSHFVADTRIPASTQVHPVENNTGQLIQTEDGRPAFHLEFKEKTARLFVASGWLWLLCILFVVSLFVWIHCCCLYVGKKIKPVSGWLVLFLTYLACNLAMMKLHVPLGFANATVFSPKLLASGDFIHSFADLIFSCLLDAWLLIYLIKYVPLHFGGRRHRVWDIAFRIGFSLIMILILLKSQIDKIYKLVIDSKISFEVSDFGQLSVYTFLGIGVLIVITLNFIFILSIINKVLKRRTASKLLRYSVVVVLSAVCIYLFENEENYLFYFIMLVMSLLGMILSDNLGLPVQISSKSTMEISKSQHSYIWFIIMCVWITSEIFYFNYSKEKDLRKIFANKQEQRDDARVSFAFDNLTSDLQQDVLLKNYFQHPDPTLQNSLRKHLLFRYLSSQFRKYATTLYFYDKRGKPLSPADTQDRILIKRAEAVSGKPVNSGIVFLDHPEGKSIYWGMAPVLNLKKTDTLGYVGFDFAVDKRPRKDYIASLMQQNYNPTDQQYFDKYSYGIYRNGILWAQGGSQIFPFRSSVGITGAEYVFQETLFRSTLIYRASPSETILVVYHRNVLINVISLFSYVLAVLMTLAGIYLLLTYLIRNPISVRRFWRRRLNLTIRAKINLTILTTVFLSLIVVGVLTISFLKNKYKETQQINLQNLMFYFSQNIIHFIENKTLDLSNPDAPLQIDYPDLNFLLNSLAEEQNVDINLFNSEGIMIATSQSGMLEKGFLSPFLNRKVYLGLKSGMKSDVVVAERNGQLRYQSLYLPLRNKNDEIIAYLNLPYYASQAELSGEISNILATLINIYTLILFISIVFAIFISNSIIKSFHLLINQFRIIRLRHNVLIQWPYRDELGLLVKEYNAMILKVEAMATKLANSEREAGWRELALQVAHEIKNPLTPMKLNIQYLQQAVKQGHPDIAGLVRKISETMVEQIENMNVIATEFAHFAKMPDAKPEVFDVVDTLQSIVALFQKEGTAEVALKAHNENCLMVYMDKGYFLRIFTNLIKNGIQAVPDGVAGRIDVDAYLVHDNIVVTVQDNGTGIAPEMQHRMFTPYFTTKSSGTGIGLSMSKNMVDNANGKIWFETEVGSGSIFYVSFPHYRGENLTEAVKEPI